MTSRPSFLRDIGNYLTGRAALLLLGVASFPLLTRLLSVADYGVLSFALRIVLLFTVLAKCGLQYSAARFYDPRSETDPHHKRRFYSTYLLGPTLISIVLSLAFFTILRHTQLHATDPLLYSCLLALPVLVVTRTMQSLLLTLLRNEGRSALHSALEIAGKCLTLAAFTVLFLGNHHTARAVLLVTIASEVVLVLIQLTLLLRRKMLAVRLIDWPLIRVSLLFGAPLIGYELFSIVLDSGDRFLVQHLLGNVSLGLYSAAYNISGYLQDTVMTPLNLAIFPIYMRIWNEQGGAATAAFLAKAFNAFCVGALAFSGLSLLCSHDVIQLLASRRYAGADHLLPILIPALLLYATHIFLNVGLILEKRTVTLAVLVAVSAGLNVSLNLLMIPRFGLAGAAWATLFSYLALILALGIINQRILPLRIDLPLLGKAAFSAGIAYAFSARITTTSSILTLLARTSLDLTIFSLLLLSLSAEARAAAASIRRRIVPARPAPATQELSLASELRDGGTA